MRRDCSTVTSTKRRCSAVWSLPCTSSTTSTICSTARRAEPQDDLVSGLLAVEEAGDVLTEEELRSIVLLLFLAGHETTMNLIGNGLFALMQHRDQWDRLVADRSLVPSTVEELLRYDGPVHITGRLATEDLEVGGHAVSEGDAGDHPSRRGQP